MAENQPSDGDDLPVSNAYNQSPEEVSEQAPEMSDEVVREALHEGPEYPDEVEEAWEEVGSMEGDAPTA